ncbi:MAG TPA: PilZ domain-containing protein, partial [Candidatus Deferrimicrobiaceae bacterium]|nr:PilZ domain-containing protein [Candidatus Deferrimicrobiaceae bacterium]
ADGRVGVGQVVDTSLSGMRIATDLDLEPDTPLTLRITLPKDTGRLEILVKVARRDPHGFGVAFLTAGEGEAERVAPFVAPGDIRRWARRVAVSLPVRIETGTEDSEVIHGRTVDLSTSGCRLTTEGHLSVSDVVVVELPGPEVGATLRLPALVWEAYTGGAVVVFANLARGEYVKLRDFLNHFG